MKYPKKKTEKYSHIQEMRLSPITKKSQPSQSFAKA